MRHTFINAIQAFKLFTTIDPQKFAPKMILQIGKLSNNVFGEVDEKILGSVIFPMGQARTESGVTK